MEKRIIFVNRNFYSKNAIGEKEFEKREYWEIRDCQKNSSVGFELSIDGIGTAKSDELWKSFYEKIADAVADYYRRQVALGYFAKKEERRDDEGSRVEIYTINEEIFVQ